jgi:putative OPT family oligopeptide transporter
MRAFMAEPNGEPVPEHKPYIPSQADIPEFTWSAVLVGTVLGILFGASSLYLLLKVGMTVSASVPIAVLSITLFRVFSNSFGFRRATILENNVVQTTGSAGESIAFGVGVTMPALLLLGFEMEVSRVMIVAVLGGVLGILMMIPLRRAFIVKQHGKLIYPEGTACAEVLVAGEKGGSTARMVFIGFGIAAVHKLLNQLWRLWPETSSQNLYTVDADGTKSGLKGAAISGELTPELMGVGYLIGPRIAALMLGGAILSYWVIGPVIATFGDQSADIVPPALHQMDQGVDKGLIKNMEPGQIQKNYLRYIGAGAVAAGGIISMLRAMPLIIGSIVGGLRDLRATRMGGQQSVLRTERDLSMNVVLFGSLGLVVVLMLVPSLGLGLGIWGLLGALMILLFGFLFVTVSSRLTGEIGSSSNPISGMTIATLLMTCLIFFALGRTIQSDPAVPLTALMVAAVVCIASSNGGTTSQDLKTGFLVGATPKRQQWAILIGAITSALVIGITMLALNTAGTHYTKKHLPKVPIATSEDIAKAPKETVGRPYADQDPTEYRVIHVTKNQEKEFAKKGQDVKAGRYLVNADGYPKYKTDIPIDQKSDTMDNGEKAPKSFAAPQPQLFALITEGILGGELEWGLVSIGVLIAIAVQLAGVSALPFAVGMYLPLGTSTGIFIGGMIRLAADKARGKPISEAESETSSGVLLSSGYIAGGTLIGLILALLALMPDAVYQSFMDALDLSYIFPGNSGKIVALVAFGILGVILFFVGKQRPPEPVGELPDNLKTGIRPGPG